MKYYVDYDEETTLWCVFNLQGKAVSSWASEEQADEHCKELNRNFVLQHQFK